jgi:hypothetical protein
MYSICQLAACSLEQNQALYVMHRKPLYKLRVRQSILETDLAAHDAHKPGTILLSSSGHTAKKRAPSPQSLHKKPTTHTQ